MRQKEKGTARICFLFSTSAAKPHPAFIVSVALLSAFLTRPLWHLKLHSWYLALISLKHTPLFFFFLSISSFLLCSQSFSHVFATLTQVTPQDDTTALVSENAYITIKRGKVREGRMGVGWEGNCFCSPICCTNCTIRPRFLFASFFSFTT